MAYHNITYLYKPHLYLDWISETYLGGLGKLVLWVINFEKHFETIRKVICLIKQINDNTIIIVVIIFIIYHEVCINNTKA